MRCQFCNEILFKSDLPKEKHEKNCGMNPKYNNFPKKCTCFPELQKAIPKSWNAHKGTMCVRCGGEL